MKFLRTPEHKHLMKLLVSARKKLGLTQVQLAQQLGEKQNFVSRYETGERGLGWLEVAALSHPLRFSIAQAKRDIEAEHGPIVNPKLRKPGELRSKSALALKRPATKKSTAKVAHKSRRKARSTAA